MAPSLTVPGRFNGPRKSGNGGYSAGALAAVVGEPALVNLRSFVPLDRPLDLSGEEDGGFRLLDGATLVAEGRTAPGFRPDLPDPVSVEEARRASEGYRGLTDGEFSCCFVCGRSRADSMAVFPGPVEGREMVASPWTPPDWSAGPDGEVRPEIVWAVLDCPTYFATHIDGELTAGYLAALTARIDALPVAGEEHVVVAWPIEIDGRKHHAGSAIFGADGELRACARALMIEPRPS